MERYLVKKRLSQLLERVSYHEFVFDEIITLVVNTGITSQFIRLLEKNLTMIEELGVKVTQTNNFEKLKNADGICSMKFKGKNMNLRMLYSFDKEFSVIFLHCFYEKEDSGRYRYDKHIPIALLRKQEMEEKNGY